MRTWVAIIWLVSSAGCCGPLGGPTQPMREMFQPVVHENPAFVVAGDHEQLWENLVDVVDDYFRIEWEERPSGAMTEGRIDTHPRIAATLLEPWHWDSVGRRERLESTLQTMRRLAEIRVVPAERGYWVHVAVYKELEDMTRPQHASAGAATFRSDATLTRVIAPINDQPLNEGWIPMGRDALLEQRIIHALRARLGSQSCPPRAGC